MDSLQNVLNGISQAAGTVKNVISPSTPAPAPSVTVSVPAQKTNWTLIGGIAGAVLLVVGVMFFASRKS